MAVGMSTDAGTTADMRGLSLSLSRITLSNGSLRLCDSLVAFRLDHRSYLPLTSPWPVSLCVTPCALPKFA